MKILFNKAENGAEELRDLTSSYYANNDFSKIRTELLLQTEAIIDIIGPAVYRIAEDTYYNGSSDDIEQALVQHVQLPIAYAAALAFYRSNIVSHEDNGRKIKINNQNEKMPWEWMYDRDDEAHQTKANKAIDRLLQFLDKSNLGAWKNSEAQKFSRQLFISNAADFNRIYPIENSGLFYHKIKPYINEIQRTRIKPSIGKELYNALLAYHQSIEKQPDKFNDIDLGDLLAFVQTAIPMLTMSLAVDRLPLNFMPYGIVQEFKSMMQTSNASQVALDDTIRRFKIKFDRSANRALDELKQFLNSAIDYDDYPLLPENPEDQKYFRT